jgi:hypothetical protein
VNRNVRKEFFQPKAPLGIEEIERRLHSRFPINVPVQLVSRQSKKIVAGIAKNIGVGGCYVDTSETFPAGTLVEFSLKCGDNIFRTRARVTYSLTCTGIGMGVAFTENDLPDWLTRMDGDFGCK